MEKSKDFLKMLFFLGKMYYNVVEDSKNLIYNYFVAKTYSGSSSVIFALFNSYILSFWKFSYIHFVPKRGKKDGKEEKRKQ